MAEDSKSKIGNGNGNGDAKREKDDSIKIVEDMGKNFLEDLQRVQAEFENYIKRVEKEKEQDKLKVKSELLLKLINVKEDLEKALENIEDKGIEMIYNNLKKILEEENVSEIKSLGERFNHEVHEVVKKIEGAENYIVEEAQRGYKIGDKILRIAKVIVGGKNEWIASKTRGINERVDIFL